MNNKSQSQDRMALSFSGPLPPANQFAEYEHTLPGAADRILALAEKEMEHRHQNEEVIVKKSMSLGGKGQIFSFNYCFNRLILCFY